MISFQFQYGHVDRSKKMLYWLWIPFVLHLFQFVNLVPYASTEEGVNLDDARKCMLREAKYQVRSRERWRERERESRREIEREKERERERERKRE